MSSDRSTATKVGSLRAGARRVAGFLTAVLLLLGFAASLAVGALPASATTPTSTWTELSPSASPTARYAASLAYDPGSGANTGQLVLFGGASSVTDFHDTWTWNGANWTQLSPATSPSARFFASMAYDAATGQLVLFGGEDRSGNVFSDTWIWNGTTWIPLTPATSPPARSDASMAYDATTHQLVLFGGYGNDGPLGDTWTWNGATWTQLSPATSPSIRSDASMSYDASTGTLVLFGGLDINSNALGDTWSWNGTTWTQYSPAKSPDARSDAAMAYDAGIGKLMLFGGLDLNGNVLSDTWTWDGTTWTLLSPGTSPNPRSDAAMADNPEGGQLVLFGGADGDGNPLGDTWTFMLTPLVTVTNNPGVLAGGTLTFTAKVAGPAGGPTPTGTLTWTVTPPGGGSVLCSSTTGPSGSSNVATYTCSITGARAGTYSATAAYPGDPNYAAASGSDTSAVVAIAQGPPTSGTTTTATSSTFTDQLTTTGQSGTVTFVSTSASCGVLVSSSGAITTTGTLPAGRCTVSGTDSDTAGDSGTWTFTLAVNGVPSTTTLSISRSSIAYGAEISEVFTTTVTGAGSRSPTGTVTIKDGSMTLCSTTAFTHKGADAITASCAMSDFKLPVGSYSVTASYSGDHFYMGSTSKPKSFSVTRGSTTITVSQSPTAVGFGDESATVFTVTMTTGDAQAVPNGTTAIVHVGSATCTVTLTDGTGTCTIGDKALQVGSYTVTASFSGDANLGASTHTGSTPLTVSGGTAVPTALTGEPWLAQLYWWLTGGMALAGLALFELGRRRFEFAPRLHARRRRFEPGGHRFRSGL